MTAELISKHIAILAKKTADLLATEAKTNIELRDALRTVKLNPNAVRIGKYDITRVSIGDNHTYAISSSTTGKVIAENIVYYDTCQILVSYLNKNVSPKSITFNTYIRNNERLLRLMADIANYSDMIDTYGFEEQPEKNDIIENRLEMAMAKADILRKRLLSK